MAMLHVVNKSPFERDALEACLRLAKKGSSVLLIEDGIYAAMTGTGVSSKLKDIMSDLTFYVMGPDVKARGVSEDKMIEGIKTVDYSGFVDLTVEHDNVQSWL